MCEQYPQPLEIKIYQPLLRFPLYSEETSEVLGINLEALQKLVNDENTPLIQGGLFQILSKMQKQTHKQGPTSPHQQLFVYPWLQKADLTKPNGSIQTPTGYLIKWQDSL